MSKSRIAVLATLLAPASTAPAGVVGTDSRCGTAGKPSMLARVTRFS